MGTVKPAWVDPRPAQNAKLLASIKRALPRLRELLDKTNEEWCYEDGIYRFYHQSFKVYGLQDHTTTIVNALAALAEGPLNEDFMAVVNEGTGKKFEESHNGAWSRHTRPIVEAFFHAHFFLTMVVKYGSELEEAPSLLPSGWASVLYLYGQR